MTEPQEKPKGEVLIDLIEDLLDINFKILALLDQRLTDLEDAHTRNYEL